jgi:spermidine/putrescine transport system permease protein
MRRKFFAYPYVAWMLLLILLPMLVIVFYAFTLTDGDSFRFTLTHMIKIFDMLNIKILLRSVWLSLLATAVCLVAAYPVAYILSRLSAGKTPFLYVLFVVPMWMNFLLRTYAWMILLDMNGLINRFLVMLGFGRIQLMYNVSAVVFGMIYNFLPFMILPIYTMLLKIPKELVEAAQDLGADEGRVFWRVVFPLSLPGVISGITMVFIPGITTFAISRLLGGAQFMLFGDLIENQFILLQDWHFGSALSLMMMVLVFICMGISNSFDKETKGGALI